MVKIVNVSLKFSNARDIHIVSRASPPVRLVSIVTSLWNQDSYTTTIVTTNFNIESDRNSYLPSLG